MIFGLRWIQYLSEICVSALLSSSSRYPSSPPPPSLPSQKLFHVWTSTMADEAKTRRSVRVESAEIAGTKISSTETSSTVTAGGLGSLGGCRAKAASVVFADVRDPPLEVSPSARSGLLLAISFFEVDVACLSEMFPYFLLKYFVIMLRLYWKTCVLPDTR